MNSLFVFQFPDNLPCSVALQPGPSDVGKVSPSSSSSSSSSLASVVTRTLSQFRCVTVTSNLEPFQMSLMILRSEDTSRTWSWTQFTHPEPGLEHSLHIQNLVLNTVYTSRTWSWTQFTHQEPGLEHSLHIQNLVLNKVNTSRTWSWTQFTHPEPGPEHSLHFHLLNLSSVK